MVIVRRKGERLGDEWTKYHPGILVEFNDKAYMNKDLFLKYIQLHLIPVLEGRPTLFAIDLCTSHKTPAVLDSLRQNRILPSLIPAGCTSLVQPLDVSINKPLKEYIWVLTDEAIRDCENIGDFEKWSVGQWRVLTTCCVGDAWYQFCIEKQDIVKRVFRKLGLSLPIDRSADHEIDIKGFQEIEVEDWSRDLNEEDQLADVSIEHDSSDLVEFVAYGEWNILYLYILL